MPRARRLAVLAGTLLMSALVAGGALALAPATSAAAAPPASGDSDDQVAVYPGDPEAEAALVSAEEDRLSTVRESAAVAQRADIAVRPYRLASGDRLTLVLVPRVEPYTLDELATIAPRSVTRQPDGFLITEHIVVQQGAVLTIASENGATVRLRSDADGFVSIVGIGGTIRMSGTDAAPLTVKSWDATAEASDLETADGRAYVRVIGGSAELSHASFSDLGFWSGRTGGVSLTGTASISDDTAADITGSRLLPADGSEDGLLDLTADDDVVGVVTGRITDVAFTRNAFGLFVTRGDGIAVVDSTITKSLVGGVVFHRDVTNSRIASTTSTGNALDGFAVTRASTGVIIEAVTAKGNGRNGIALEGAPLAEGPSAAGTPTVSYGKNQVRESRATGNRHYGIAVVGGSGIVVDANTVTGGDMGIVVSSGAVEVSITGNQVRGAERQGIALREAGTDAVVTGNTVQAGLTGIYVREAGGTIEQNWIEGVALHGITLVGETGRSVVRDNAISGSGPSAIDLDRTTGVKLGGNDTDEWTVTRPLPVLLRSIFRPLTVVWVLVIAVILYTAVKVARQGKRPGIRDPYESNAPLSTFTQGAVPPELVRAQRSWR